MQNVMMPRAMQLLDMQVESDCDQEIYLTNRYNEELPGWHKDQIPARLTVGMGTETIWMNYQPIVQMKLEV